MAAPSVESKLLADAVKIFNPILLYTPKAIGTKTPVAFLSPMNKIPLNLPSTFCAYPMNLKK